MWSSNTEALADSYLDEELYLLIREAGNQQESCKLSLSCRLCLSPSQHTNVFFFFLMLMCTPAAWITLSHRYSISLTFARQSSSFSGAATITAVSSKNLQGLIPSNSCLCGWAEVVPPLLLCGKMWCVICNKPLHCHHQSSENADNDETFYLILSSGEQVSIQRVFTWRVEYTRGHTVGYEAIQGFSIEDTSYPFD